MAKHSKRERERRATESERVRPVEAAWVGSVPPATVKQFTLAGEAAPARGPGEAGGAGPGGTKPRAPPRPPAPPPPPPRPAQEPKPPKEERGRRPSRD